jgi:hypothetical protein
MIAADFYQETSDSKAAEQHRACAEALILGLANSFEEGEALARLQFVDIGKLRREPVGSCAWLIHAKARFTTSPCTSVNRK